MQLLSSLIKLHGMVLGSLEKTGNIIIEEIINDDWKGEFRLAGKTIEIVTKLKILGQILSDDGKDIEHVGKRKAQNTIMLTKLQ